MKHVVSLFSALVIVLLASSSFASSPDRLKLGTHFGSLLFEEACRTCGDDFVNQLDEEAPALLAALLEVPNWVVDIRSSYERLKIEDVKAARDGSDRFSVTISVGWGDCGLGCVNRHEWKIFGSFYKHEGADRQFVEVHESGRALPRGWVNKN